VLFIGCFFPLAKELLYCEIYWKQLASKKSHVWLKYEQSYHMHVLFCNSLLQNYYRHIHPLFLTFLFRNQLYFSLSSSWWLYSEGFQGINSLLLRWDLWNLTTLWYEEVWGFWNLWIIAIKSGNSHGALCLKVYYWTLISWLQLFPGASL
jgi:hypothetical protein